MSRIEFSYEVEGKRIELSGDGEEIKDIAKLILNPNPSLMGAVSVIPLLKSFDFDEEIEKPMKSKAIIKKVNAHTVEVKGQRLSLNDNYVGDLKKAGTDYYIYKIEDDYALTIDKDNKNIIGGFHYGVIPEDFKPINNIDKNHAKKIAGINAYSIWDMKHRPVCEPEGMVYIPKLDVWVDIYLLNSNHKSGTSQSTGNIAAGSSDEGRKVPEGEKDLSKKVRVAIGEYHKKREITKHEFQVAADGVKENDSARDLDDGTIKHLDDFTSKYGLCQATGVQWTWSDDKYDNRDDAWYILGGLRVSEYAASSRCVSWSSWGDAWRRGCRFVGDSLNPVK